MSITVGETETGRKEEHRSNIGARPISGIHWETDFERALEKGAAEGKQILVDFFNPN
jgi:hypothetical protein